MLYTAELFTEFYYKILNSNFQRLQTFKWNFIQIIKTLNILDHLEYSDNLTDRIDQFFFTKDHIVTNIRNHTRGV